KRIFELRGRIDAVDEHLGAALAQPRDKAPEKGRRAGHRRKAPEPPAVNPYHIRPQELDAVHIRGADAEIVDGKADAVAAKLGGDLDQGHGVLLVGIPDPADQAVIVDLDFTQPPRHAVEFRHRAGEIAALARIEAEEQRQAFKAD